MKSKISLELIQEGFVLYTIWRANRYRDYSNLDILELTVKRDVILKYFKLLPLQRISKECGSYEYRYSKQKSININNVNLFLNYDDFNCVLYYSEFEFVDDLVRNGIEEATKKIKMYRRKCLSDYKNQKPEHTQCKLHLTDKCLCPIRKNKNIGLSRTKQIGLGVESIIKNTRISSADVLKDEFTTITKKFDKHILYVPGWSLDDDK